MAPPLGATGEGPRGNKDPGQQETNNLKKKKTADKTELRSRPELEKLTKSTGFGSRVFRTGPMEVGSGLTLQYPWAGEQP